MPVFETMLTAHSLLTPHRTRLDLPRAVLSELAVRKRLDSTVIMRNREIPGQATAGQLQAAASSVRVIYQSSGTVLCCVHSVFPLTRSIKQCYDAALKVNSSAIEYKRTPNSLQQT